MVAVVTQAAEISLIENHIIRVRFLNNADVTLEQAKEITSTAFELTGNHPFVSLIDARDILGSMSAEARDYFAKDIPLSQKRIAQAILIDNVPIRLLANFYLKFHKPIVPADTFGDEKEALTWLRLHLDKKRVA